MKATTAKVLQCIGAHAPCTKLCVKTHSGLSMSTVLSAVDELAAAGWIECEQIWVPQGGKPHANLSMGKRRLWGAVAVEGGVEIASIGPDGKVLDEPSLPLDAQGVCIGGKVGGLVSLPPPRALCYAHSAAQPTAVIGRDLLVYLPYGDPVDLGDMPSPMLGKTRLNYREAFGVADPPQSNLLRQEISLWISKLCACTQVLFEEDFCPLSPATAARAALFCLYHIQ